VVALITISSHIIHAPILLDKKFDGTELNTLFLIFYLIFTSSIQLQVLRKMCINISNAIRDFMLRNIYIW
jgi:hypothetical protein